MPGSRYETVKVLAVYPRPSIRRPTSPCPCSAVPHLWSRGSGRGGGTTGGRAASRQYGSWYTCPVIFQHGSVKSAWRAQNWGECDAMTELLWVRRLTMDETETLNRWHREGRDDTGFRVVWLSAKRSPVPRIATRLGVSEATVRSWIHRFNQEGIGGLQRSLRPGRPRTITDADLAIIRDVAPRDPRALGHHVGIWTLSTLRTYLAAHRGVRISKSWLDTILHREGIDLGEVAADDEDADLDVWNDLDR